MHGLFPNGGRNAMKVEKKPNIKLRAAVILNGLVALIWVVYSALDFVYDTSSTLLRVLRVFCAVFWCVIFVLY